MWVCKYCETKNESGSHCFLCGFFNDPALSKALSAEAETPEKNSRVIEPAKAKKPEKRQTPEISHKPEKRKTEPARCAEKYVVTESPGKYTDTSLAAETMYEHDKRLVLTAKRNKKKQNKIKAAFAAVNILLAAANAIVCYFVFR